MLPLGYPLTLGGRVSDSPAAGVYAEFALVRYLGIGDIL